MKGIRRYFKNIFLECLNDVVKDRPLIRCNRPPTPQDAYARGTHWRTLTALYIAEEVTVRWKKISKGKKPVKKAKVVMPFGIYIGKRLEEVPENYIKWLVKNEVFEKEENKEIKKQVFKFFNIKENNDGK